MFSRRRGVFASLIIEKLGFIKLFSAIGFACVATIWAIYLESFLHSASAVGFLTSFFAVVSFIAYFLIIPLLEKKDKVRIYLLALGLYALSYLMFFFLKNIISIIILGVLISILASLMISSSGILVRNKSKSKDVSKNEGFIYTLLNISWLIGPLIAGFIANKYGISAVFLLAALFVFVSFILLKISKLRDHVISRRIDTNPFKVLKDFLKDKERIVSYFLSGGINFWWTLIYIYMPLYIIKNGLTDLMLGYFLALITLPMILSEYYFGKLSCKIGFKKVFVAGYFILAISALLCFFIPNIYLILLILVLSSFGAAMIEPTTEAYFFDIITEREREKYYSIYNTTIEVNYFLASILAAALLLFLPFKSVFILFGIAMLFFSLLSFKIRNVIEKRRIN